VKYTSSSYTKKYKEYHYIVKSVCAVTILIIVNDTGYVGYALLDNIQV